MIPNDTPFRVGLNSSVLAWELRWVIA